MIKEQNRILAPPSNNKSSYSPDFGHVIKNCNNEIYKLKTTDRSYEGVRLLSNRRITSIHADIRSVVKEYHAKLGDAQARNDCVKRIAEIIPHHCGDHSLCKTIKFCTYLQTQKEHPEWTIDQLKYAVAARSELHGG
jgi:hypothetical protein